MVSVIEEAKERNFTQWPVIGIYVWGNYYVGKTYADEITYLKQWIEQRVAWLDSFFGLPAAVQPSPGVRAPEEFALYQN